MENMVIDIPKFYGSLPNMLHKFDRFARQDAFKGSDKAAFEEWKVKSVETLKELLGWSRMETCPLEPALEESIVLDSGIIREKVIIQVEPEVFMPMYILIPPKEKEGKQDCFIALPGHQGAGKYSVAGCYEIPAVKEKIDLYHYDYGMQLAKRGYVAICPDCRGFGERRDEALRKSGDVNAFMGGTCFHLAHMAEPMGETVAGMCAWDVSRLIDYIYERDEWNTETLGVMGFSGGGMQTLWSAVMDQRVKQAIISGYLYGYKDSLQILNGNCSCNYVPHLWEHFDMGDIASIIAPRPLVVQSCRGDHLNGPRGLANVMEQLAIVKAAYKLYGREQFPYHDVREGEHCWHEEVLENGLPCLRKGLEKEG